MPRFADCARSECPSYADLVLALAGEFHDADVDGAERALRRLEAMIADTMEATPNEQLGEVAATVAGQIAPPPRRPRGDEDVMLDAVLTNGRGQPVILTVIAAEVAARQGMRLGIVSDGRRHMLAHRDAEEPLVADFAAGRLRHPEELRADLCWHCSHQVASALLSTLEERAVARGDLSRAMRAAELQLALPLDPDAHGHARVNLFGLRARLN
jgi:regulator of sirC expression with transglutaminase-like and TPR domain